MHCGVSFYVQALVWHSLMFRQTYLRVFLDPFHYTFITPSSKGYFCGKNFNEFSYVQLKRFLFVKHAPENCKTC